MRSRTVLGIVAVIAALAVASLFLLRANEPAPPAASDAPAAAVRAAPLDMPASASAALAAESRARETADRASPSDAAAADAAAGRAPASKSGPTTRATGLVLDFDGRPAPNAEIRFIDETSGSTKYGHVPSPAATSDAEGRFTADIPLDTVKTFQVRASRLDRRHARLHGVTLATDSAADVGVLRFEACGALDIRVTGEDGRPVPNLWVQRRVSTEEVWWTCGVSFEDGVVRVPAVLTATMLVRVRPENDAPWRSDPVEVAVAQGETRRVDLVVRGLATLAGRATANGAPVREEWLALHPSSEAAASLAEVFGFQRTKTDREGRFEFRATPPGRYLVNRNDPGEPFRFDPEHFPMKGIDVDIESVAGFSTQRSVEPRKGTAGDASRQVQLRAGMNRIDVEFGGLVIPVRVIDAQTGAPAPDALIGLFDLSSASTPEASSARPVRVRVRADAQGRAELRDLEPGRFGLVAGLKARAASDVTEIELGAGNAAIVTLSIPATAELAGRVVDEAGRPLAGAVIYEVPRARSAPRFPGAQTDEFGTAPIAKTGDDGAFTLTPLAPGALRAAAFADGLAPATLDVQVPSKGHLIVLRRPATIRATARRVGKPVDATVWVDTHAPDAPLSADAADALGSNAGTLTADTPDPLTGLVPGGWTVMAREKGKDDSRPGSARVHVLPGETLDVVIDLPE